MDGIEPTEPEDQTEGEQGAGRLDAWRRRSAIGGMATGLALGLGDIFSPTKPRPVITAEAPGDPPDASQRLRVVLDPDDPTRSVAILPEDTPLPEDSPPPDRPTLPS
ncbi:MAG: hypothetical protein ACLPVF_12365 [Acidimicrobiales bacterium]